MKIGCFNVYDADATKQLAAIMSSTPELFEDDIYIHFTAYDDGDIDEDDKERKRGDVDVYDKCRDAAEGYSFPPSAFGCPQADDYSSNSDKYDAETEKWMSNDLPRLWTADSAVMISLCDSIVYKIKKQYGF